jgi:hypothetical protein
MWVEDELVHRRLKKIHSLQRESKKEKIGYNFQSVIDSDCFSLPFSFLLHLPLLLWNPLDVFDGRFSGETKIVSFDLK